MSHHIQFKCTHIEGIKNDIADAISRFQIHRFKSLDTVAQPSPTPIPAEFLKIISDLKLTDC